jgi:glycogen operon protein
VNFSLFSRHATRVELLLYEAAGSPEPFQSVVLDPEENRSFFCWHVFVEGLPAGTHYTWRVDGPQDTATSGQRFNPRKELLDPWARAVSGALWDRRRAADPGDASHSAYRAVVVDRPDGNVQRLPARGLEGAVIYELHVGGFTRHPSSGTAHPGTFAALREKIPYLQELGVTHVELLPVMAFDEQDVPAGAAARGLRNYWGYSSHSFWAPHPGYCINPAQAGSEFRDLTQALHRAGIGVILDVVFNHTAEGGAAGPWINFRGLGNEVFYHLDAADRRRYLDFTGCGNTVNCNHPLVTAFIVHCLEYWVECLGVDGFRFDLASVFARGEHGAVLPNPPLPWAIELSRSLAEVPLIAEAWDAAGLYHVGAFPGLAWAEWNGRYRDALRRFVRGEPGTAGEAASRIAGSSDLYADDGRRPANGINFVTCHDGFTLWDLVSHNDKHNEANGEGNRDGSNDNLSWNCGAEGETRDPAVLALRRRQARNFMALLLLSRGVPMLLGGDEVLRSQGGNNNAYAQDNAISWLDWGLAEANRDMLRFTREMIALRRRHPCLTRNRFYSGREVPGRGMPDIAWHGSRLNEPPWRGGEPRCLAFTVAAAAAGEEDLHVIANMGEQAWDALLPEIPGRRWHLALDTAQASPADITSRAGQRPHSAFHYPVAPRSVVVLEAR